MSPINHIFPLVTLTHCLVSAIRHAEEIAVKIPSCHAVKKELLKTLFFFFFVCKGSNDVLLSRTIHNNKWIIFHVWLKPQEGIGKGLRPEKSTRAKVTLMSSSKIFRTSLIFYNMPPTLPHLKLVNTREEGCFWQIKLLCTSTSFKMSFVSPTLLPWLYSDIKSPAQLIFLSSMADPHWDREPEFITICNNL